MLDIITGPMFAGKSTELLRRIRRYEHAGRNCIVIKWQGDTRYQGEGDTHCHGEGDTRASTVVTHDYHHRTALSVTRMSELVEEKSLIDTVDVIAIDEGQFFEDIVEACSSLSRDKIVIVSCLDGTSEQEPFPNIARLFSKADTVTKLSAVCTGCKRDAPFTKRITGAPHPMIAVGGSEMYTPCCRMCLDLPNVVAQEFS